MNAYESAVDEFVALQPHKYGYLERLELKRSIIPSIESRFHLEIDLRAEAFAGAKCLSLAFEGVQDLQVGDLFELWSYHVEIRSIAERQLEGLKYKACETEHQAFSFMFESFTAVVR